MDHTATATVELGSIKVDVPVCTNLKDTCHVVNDDTFCNLIWILLEDTHDEYSEIVFILFTDEFHIVSYISGVVETGMSSIIERTFSDVYDSTATNHHKSIVDCNTDPGISS